MTTIQKSAVLTALRGVLMVLAGLYAIIFPGWALTVLIALGGALLLVDGLLGVWSLTFGHARSGNYWFDVIRNILAILTGVLILASPLLATIITATLLIYILAAELLIVGGMEMWGSIRAYSIPTHGARFHIWPVFISGLLAVIFAIVLIVAPLAGATLFVILGGILMLLFSVALFGLARRLWVAGR